MLQSERDNLIKWNGREKPFYEVYYLKLNDPSFGAALWLRYTFLSPVIGESSASVWAIFSNSKNPGKNLALKETVSLNEVVFRKGVFDIDIGGAKLYNNSASGGINKNDASITWNLGWQPSEKSHRHYPSPLYHLPFPSTKVIAPNMAVPASGWFTVNGVKYDINTVLHQGHVWGRCYSSQWAWANCGLFNEDISSVLELLAGSSFGLGYLKFDGAGSRLLISGKYRLKEWTFVGRGLSVKIAGRITARPQDIMGITYNDPAGGYRYCYNTKVADAVVDVYKKARGGWQCVGRLTSSKTCAYENVMMEPAKEIPLVL